MSPLDPTLYESELTYWKQTILQLCQSLRELPRNKVVLDVLSSHEEFIRKTSNKTVFNVFEVISDRYYLENFHSDMIAFFLNPEESHQYGNKGLSLFINCLSLQQKDYANAKVYREYAVPGGSIDILIKDESSQHAIIIENKMNRAYDMPRQIPRYCNSITKEGYSVDVAVYLPLDRFSYPEQSSWVSGDEKWNSYIKVLPAYAEEGYTSLVTSWLDNLAKAEISADCASTVRQYSRLIIKLSNQSMDKQAFEKFYDYLRAEDNLMTSNSFVSMMNDLPKYLAQRIFDCFNAQPAPFSRVWIYSNTAAAFDYCYISGVQLKMDVFCSTDNYYIRLWCDKDEDRVKLAASANLKDFLLKKGLSVFNDYGIEYDLRITKLVPISTKPEDVVKPILDQLLPVCDH